MKNQTLSVGKMLPLSIQHIFAMFGATILVPALTGLDMGVALFTSAIGTLLFHFITKGQVPAYLGSSFAFIYPIQQLSTNYSPSVALGGAAVAGVIYLIVSTIIKRVGTDFLKKVLPPVVVGPVIMTIGLSLAPVAKDMSSTHTPTAVFTLILAISLTAFGKGFLRVIPLLLAIIGGYLFALGYQWVAPLELFGMTLLPSATIIDFTEVFNSSWVPALPNFTAPKFEINAMLYMIPFVLVTLVEHLGDILAIGRTIDKDLMKKPGLSRTLAGDGVATLVASFLGGPPNTTYGENIGVLAITKVKDSRVIQLAAVLVIILSVNPKFVALLGTIPEAVMGGIVILLFGMIASIGIRTLVENKVDLGNTRNLVIVSTILIIGISGISIWQFEGMGLAALVGIVLNATLPNFN
ncbi:solute carrier family 23 protein [Proteinivorax hydrogeniformans]|uniref:Solute carrier family 23 protein n=1 Tax=Proteinivorax hydrogeniformans TaxID=1826727 RepID=A0AAU8HQ03_9FIRM